MGRLLKDTAQIKELGAKIQQDNIPKMIMLNKLVEHEDNEYLFGGNDDDAIKNLAMGIEKEGFKGAILVWDLKNGQYKIFSGHRRKRAMESLKKDSIPCFVYPYPESETQRRRLLLGANIYTRGSIDAAVSHIYISRQIKYLRETLKMEGFSGNYKRRLAEEFGTSESKIQRYEALLNCSERILKAEDEGLIPMAQAASISVLPEDKQNSILDAVIKLSEGGTLSREEIQELINMVKNDDYKPENTEEFIEEFKKQIQTVNNASLINDVFYKAGMEEPAEAKLKKASENKGNKRTTGFELYCKEIDSMTFKIKSKPLKDDEQKKELIKKVNNLLKILKSK
ncbi:MAG: ParB/RepB/Spo0J family partition protein [Lachnospiraceae bacterium]|nr:ParB/RepB/Spo0J family partition protein [Lachnospiraceae bacterium]